MKTSASAVALLSGERDRLELGGHLLSGDEPLDEHRAQTVDELAEVDVVLAMLRQHLVHGGDREDPVDGVVQRLLARRRAPHAPAARRSDATDCRLFLTRWWISWASTPRITARPCSSATAAWCAIASRSASSSAENGVSRSQTSSPICRRFQRSGMRHGVRARPTLRPRDLPVLEHERRARRVQRLHRRLHDRLERLLEVERLRDGLRDARERLELGDAPLGALVELRVLDRLRDLRGDRDEQLDLGVGERARLARPDVERALELVGARHDRDGEDRLVLVLGQVRELLEARVEVRLLGDHDRRALRGRDSRDPLARPHPRRARQLLDPRAVGRAQDELVGPLVVEVDEARVRPERVGDLARDELEHLLQVERRVDRRDRLGQEPQVTSGGVHEPHCHRIRRGVSFDDWILALHVLSAFAFVAGIVLFWVLIVAVRKTDTPDGTIRMGPVVKVGNACVGIGAGGTIVLGIWLAFSVGGYDIWDPWIIAALVLWVARGSDRPAHAASSTRPA